MVIEDPVPAMRGGRPLIETAPETSLAEALATMLRRRVHHLVVRKEGELLGVVSFQSLLEAQLDQGFARLTELTVADALSDRIRIIDGTFTLRDALRAVLDDEARALLVRDREGKIDIVTDTDLLRALAQLLGHRAAVDSFRQRVEGMLASPLVQVVSKLLADSGL